MVFHSCKILTSSLVASCLWNRQVILNHISQGALKSSPGMYAGEISFLIAAGWPWCSSCTRKKVFWLLEWEKHLAFILWGSLCISCLSRRGRCSGSVVPLTSDRVGLYVPHTDRVVSLWTTASIHANPSSPLMQITMLSSLISFSITGNVSQVYTEAFINPRNLISCSCLAQYLHHPSHIHSLSLWTLHTCTWKKSSFQNAASNFRLITEVVYLL